MGVYTFVSNSLSNINNHSTKLGFGDAEGHLLQKKFLLMTFGELNSCELGVFRF